MKKFEKDLALIYENKVLNEGLPPGTGTAIKRLWNTQKPGVIGFFNRFFATRSFAEFQQQYQFLKSSIAQIEVAFKNVNKIADPNKKAAAMQGTIDNIINNPLFKELELDPDMVKNVPYTKTTKLMADHFQPELDSFKIRLATYTNLDEKIIDQLFGISSQERALQLLKSYMPLGANVTKTIKDGFVNSLKIYGLFLIIDIGINLAITAKALASAGKAFAGAVEQGAQLGEGGMQRIGDFFAVIDELADKYLPRREPVATPTPTPTPSNGGTLPGDGTLPRGGGTSPQGGLGME